MDIHVYEIHECANDRHNPPVLAIAKTDFDRVTAERDALQLRLNAVEEENDRLRALARESRNELMAMKAEIGFRAETLRVIGALDIALENRS